MAGLYTPSDTGDGASLVRSGDVVSGKFRIERVLGQGGMGVVVAARHLQLDETVALKFLRAHAIADPDALARFTREARAAAKLKSEHVARVLDAGVTDDGTPYIVMEYLEGRTLGKLVEQQGRVEIATVAEYAIQACEGLAEAHARGIIHRDIKPENLFLVERSEGWRVLKILDFGISKFDVTRGASETNLSTHGMMGSPCYMSPEQLRSATDVDHRTDLWSLGATMFELLAGGTAYSARQSLPQLIAAILERPTPKLTDLWPDIPVELSAVIARCMAKEREARFESAAELALALLPFAPKRARANVERAIAVTRSTAPSSRPATLWSDAPPPSGEATAGSSSVESGQGTLRSATSRPDPEPIDHLDTLAAPTLPISAGKKRPRLPRLVLALAAAAATAAIVAWRLASREPPAAPPANESSWSAASARVDPVATLTPPAPPAAAVLADSPQEGTSGAPDPAPTGAPSIARPSYRPAPAVRTLLPAASSSAPPASLDIRMER